MTILVTGGAGFIGSNFVLDWLAQSDEKVVNLDALTYAGNLENLASLQGDARHLFVQGDICDRALVDRLLAEQRPRAPSHFLSATCAMAAMRRTPSVRWVQDRVAPLMLAMPSPTLRPAGARLPTN